MYDTFNEALDDAGDRINKDGSGTADVHEALSDPTKIIRLSGDEASWDYACAIWEGRVKGAAVPEIYCIHEQNDEFLVVMERLVHLDDAPYYFHKIDTMCGNMWSYPLKDDVVYDEFASLHDKIRDDLRGVYDMTEREIAMLTNEFIDTWDWCIATGDDYGWCNDIHGYNVMVRQGPKPELVITDPWC